MEDKIPSIHLPKTTRIERTDFRLSRPDEHYRRDIAECLDEITAGESYEVCLTTHLIGGPLSDPLSAYRRLRVKNDVPFGAFLNLGSLSIASISPERFLKVSSTGEIFAHPIKGTAARFDSDPVEDEKSRHALLASEKDRSENLMIVDLLRNDLGRVCAIGSVHVPRLMAIESYAVHQMVSTISGRLDAGKNGVDVVEACFPGGSMTGAPKKRTMEILDRIEGEYRGVYSGALGYFSLGGSIDLSIVIRTAVLTESETRIGVGGAIVALSNPEQELNEVYLKGQTLTSILSSDDFEA